MSIIKINSLTFYYPESTDKIFDKLNLNIDTRWKLGLIGKNGRGKTTLMSLINQKLIPVSGEIRTKVKTFYFPFTPASNEMRTFDIIKESIAPFRYWEKKMNLLSRKADKESMELYAEIMEKYQSQEGYEIDSKIEKEISYMKMSNDLLKREFRTLSLGERTRALITALFLKKNSFPLIDEPTDHLDMNGRLILGEYLSQKRGFILASHDRNFLDLCIDHVLSINKSDVRINKGNYSQWKNNMDIEEEYELRKNENLRREIKSLENAAKKRRIWSNAKEKEIIGATTLKPNKGYISHKSAKLMKRALHIEARIDDKIEEKKSLLKNLEDKRKLKLNNKSKSSEILISVCNAGFKYESKIIFDNVTFDVKRGERVAILGNNGSGKTSLLKAILKEIELVEGNIYMPNFVKVSYSRQDPFWNIGMLRDHLKNSHIDETQFRNILGVMGAWGEIFDRPLETFSRGELKKVELCRSFINTGSLLIWDEPMNYLDVMSREQIENVILEYKPSMLFTEHDITFVENIATSSLSMT